MLTFFNFAESWQRQLVSIFGLLGANYNSAYQHNYEFTDFASDEAVKCILTTPFLATRVRFLQNKIPVSVFELESSLLRELGVSYEFLAPDQNEKSIVRIFIPEPLQGKFPSLLKKLSKYLKDNPQTDRLSQTVEVGQLTPSGRGLLVGWHEDSALDAPVGIKFNTLGMNLPPEIFTNKVLLPNDARYSVAVSDFLENYDFKNFFSEHNALYLKAESGDAEYVVVERSFTSASLDIRKGDYLVPMNCMLSPDFWQRENNLQTFELSHLSLQEFFEQHFVPAFARMLKNSIEETFVHYEIHQQNLTCHWRNGSLKKIIAHDLQDIIFDPLSSLLSRKRSEWPSHLKQIATLHKTKFFDFCGEPRRDNRAGIKNYHSATGFYRCYFRNFGYYDRVYSHALNQDRLGSCQLESMILQALNYSDEELDLEGYATLKTCPDFSFLRQHLFWVIARRIEVKQQAMMRQHFLSLRPQLQILTAAELALVIQRAQKDQAVVYSANIPPLAENLSLEKVKSAYAAYTEQVYFLELHGGELAVLMFIASSRQEDGT